MEADLAEDQRAATEWGGKALAASRKADEYRSQGDTADADKFDQLAKVAIGRQLESEKEINEETPQIENQRDVTDKLKQGLNEMKEKLGELKKRRDNLVARSANAAAQSQLQDAVKSIDIMDPTSEVSRFEEKIRREEAKVRGAAELASSSLDAQFNSLEDVAKTSDVDARLAALKQGAGSGAGR
jgi:phage shock protein A